MSYKFVIEGDPIVQQRPRKGKYGNFFNPDAKDKKRVGYQLLESRVANGIGLLTSDLSLDVIFYVKGNKRMDLDNLLKFLWDAGTGVVWKDDSQITEVVARKVMNSTEPRTEMTVFELP